MLLYSIVQHKVEMDTRQDRSYSLGYLGYAPYAAVDVRRPSFSGRRLSCLEQFATPRHVCTVTACFLQSSEDLSLQMQFSLTILLCPRSDTCHYGNINRYYLLTYLLTYLVAESYPRVVVSCDSEFYGVRRVGSRSEPVCLQTERTVATVIGQLSNKYVNF